MTYTNTSPQDQRHPLTLAWINVMNSAWDLLAPQPDDRPLDQYLAFRDRTINIVLSSKFLDAIDKAWPSAAQEHEVQDILDGLLLELQAFPLSVQVLMATSKPEEAKSLWSKVASRGSTTCGSVKDLLDGNSLP